MWCLGSCLIALENEKSKNPPNRGSMCGVHIILANKSQISLLLSLSEIIRWLIVELSQIISEIFAHYWKSSEAVWAKPARINGSEWKQVKNHKNAIYSKPSHLPLFPLLWDDYTHQGQPKTIESTVGLFRIFWVVFLTHVGCILEKMYFFRRNKMCFTPSQQQQREVFLRILCNIAVKKYFFDLNLFTTL